MPNPLKVKIFMDANVRAIEEQINAWLDNIGSAAVIKTETVVTPVAEQPCIVVTIWYEPPSD